MTHRSAHRSASASASALVSASVLTLLAAALGSVLAVAPAGAAGPTAPPGTITLLEHGGWSWFEDARATFNPDGSTLLLSGVAGTTSPDVDPGTVVLAQVDVASGSRRLVDLGAAETDDHNSASIDASSSGEVLTSWSRHHQDRLVHHQRRRTDGSWLRLPATDVGSHTTYNNLRRAADEAGNPILYDFVRGERLDPVALASADEGRTWVNLGRVLRDPENRIDVRPYVQYAESSDGRIHLVATESHPDQSATSIYHGYIANGLVHDSAGRVLGPLGSAVPVTSLTRVWAATSQERGWSTDIEIAPATGRPVVTFSVTRSSEDHRYRYGRWNGTAWTTEEIAHAGSALYANEESYTGLASIDPSDPTRVVISTDSGPLDGEPLVSASDGQRHWELWEGHRSPSGLWSWVPLTSDSTTDNLRPVLSSHPSGTAALVWLRGTYTSFRTYSLAVAGVITRADSSFVPSAAATWMPAVDVLPLPSPTTVVARPVVGQLDGHAADDLYLPRLGSARDDLVLGDEHRHPTPIAGPSTSSSALPVGGDFDGNGRTDIYWYAPGAATDRLWVTTGVGRLTSVATRQVTGTYAPIAGDFDGDRDTDIYWYAAGAAADNLWTATPSGFVARVPSQVNGTYVPVPGDFNGDRRTDILWYAPGAAADHLWTATTNGFTSTPRQITGRYTPVPGDYTGDGRTDILWYAPGAAADHLWTATTNGFTSTPRQISGTYTPIAGDHDGDGADDVHWYAPGPAPDFLWWSTDGPLASSEAAALNL